MIVQLSSDPENPRPGGPGSAGLVADYSDRIQLPRDIVGDPPEIADISLADECVGSPLMPPIQQIDVLTAVESRRDIGLFRRPDDQAQRPDRLVVGSIDERRRRAAFFDDEPSAAEAETPRLEIGQADLLRQALANLLQRLAGVFGCRDVDWGAIAGADNELEITGCVVEPEVVGRGRLERSLLAGYAVLRELANSE